MMVWLTVGVVAAVVMSAVALGLSLRRRPLAVTVDGREFHDQVAVLLEKMEFLLDSAAPAKAERRVITDQQGVRTERIRVNSSVQCNPGKLSAVARLLEREAER